MSDLKPTGMKITLNKKEYGLRFTLNAIDDIQDHFDIPIQDLDQLLNDEKNAIKNIKYLLMLLINEDIDCRNDDLAEKGEKRNLEHLDERYIGRYINAANMNEMSTIIYQSFTDGMPEAEDDDPNLTSE